MYAVIKSGGKQYRVSEGQTLRVEQLPGEAGASVDFGEVLLIGEGEDLRVGNPYLDGATVTGTVTAQARGKKIRIVKFRRRKHYKKEMGHRQAYTEVRITNIARNLPEGIPATA
jgi:large subunit ribosomal protein L21